MAYPFTPPNRAALWASLALTQVQLAALCGLSVQRVRHWTAQGYLSRSPRDPERYGADAIDMVLLIKQGLGQGLSLDHAAHRARAYLAAERARQPDLYALNADARATIATGIAQAEEATRQVLEVVAPLAPLTLATEAP